MTASLTPREVERGLREAQERGVLADQLRRGLGMISEEDVALQDLYDRSDEDLLEFLELMEEADDDS